jgi:hypothetical protein
MKIVYRFISISVDLTIGGLPDEYTRRTLSVISDVIESSPHIELYLRWISSALSTHGPRVQGMFPMPTLLAIEKALSRKYQQLSEM